MRLLFFLLGLFMLPVTNAGALAQVHPADGAALHYRLIGFTFPQHKDATKYRLEIFEFTTASEKIPDKSVLSKEGSSNKIIATVPAFGKEYMWRVTYLRNNKEVGTEGPHYFSVSRNPWSDTAIARVVVADSATKYKDLLLFFDNTRSLHNMKGEAVWFLPAIPGVTDSSAGIIRDMKMTGEGTIILLTTKNVHEIDYYGNVLWSGPSDGSVSGDTAEQYHHEFTKLANGHYMAIVNIRVPRKDDTAIKMSCGSVVEFNRAKEVLWLWNSCDHIHADDPATHFNSFHFDERNRLLYTSYRNLNRVVKAAYPSGRILAQYGQNLKSNSGISGHGMFYYQHNVNRNSAGDMILFNNNFETLLPAAERNRSVPTVAVFREPVRPGDTLQKIWEFSTGIDTLVQPTSSGGGSVHELDKGDYLVCTGMPGRNFIVSEDKKLLWNVLTRQREGGVWKPFAGYRISPVYAHDLEKLLFR